MSFRVVVLPRAEADIERNAEWWDTNHSAEQASRWLFRVQAQLLELSDFPESHALSAENDDFEFVIREKPVGLGARRRYRAVFTVKDDTVYVFGFESLLNVVLFACRRFGFGSLRNHRLIDLGAESADRHE